MKQLGLCGVKKTQKSTVSGQQTRRSMIARQEHPPAINQPNLQTIISLELSDTLINAAYNLAVTKITLGIHKLCNSLEILFIENKLSAFENVKIYANRMGIVSNFGENRNTVNEVLESRYSILTHIDMLKEENMIREQKNELILLTKQQQIENVRNTIVTKLQRMKKILARKLTKVKYEALIILQTYQPQKAPAKQQAKTSIQQTFEKYQQSRNNQRQLLRRSIDKQPQRKSSNQLTYSLNKHNNYQFSSRLKSPEHNTKSKNLLYTYAVNNTDKKASTCSQTQSNNSQKESNTQSREYYTQTGKSSQGNSVLNNLKVITPSKNLPYPGATRFNESRVSSLLMNGSYFAQGTKQRQLEILRNKYYRLVEEFKDFSERFLQVIKEE